MMDNRLQEKLTESFTPPEQRKAQLEKEGEEFWQRRLNKFERCGKETIDFINALDPTLVTLNALKGIFESPDPSA